MVTNSPNRTKHLAQPKGVPFNPNGTKDSRRAFQLFGPEFDRFYGKSARTSWDVNPEKLANAKQLKNRLETKKGSNPAASSQLARRP